MNLLRRTLLLSPLGALAAAPSEFELALRKRVEANTVIVRRRFQAKQSAMLICDMWDKHWCSGATTRVAEMAPKMAKLHSVARRAGIPIIHSPSDVTEFYAETPQRRRMLAFANHKPEPGLTLPDPPLPIDDKAGGCDTGESFYKAWTRETPLLPIEPEDLISDKGNEVHGFLNERGIGDLFVMGVHTNMCVLNRTFAIKQMTKWGIRCVLVRDMTDSMYDPKARPFVSHEQGTALVIEHIERHWCPSVLSGEIIAALR